MTDKFHINPDTGRAGACGAKIKCKFKLSEDEHYSTKDEAKLAYSEKMKAHLFATQQKQNARKRNRDVPKNHHETSIDNEIVEYASDLHMLNTNISRIEEQIDNYREKGEQFYGSAINRSISRMDELKKGLPEAIENLRKAESKYQGWSRYVSVPGGHVHYYDCSTLSTYKSQAATMLATEASALSTDELVEMAGERACTVCFPDAPVDRPSMMRADIEAREKAAERKSELSEKAEKKRISSLNDDGSSVSFDGYTYKTIRSLETAIGNSLYYTLRAKGKHPNVTDSETINWHKEKSAEDLAKIESMREVLTKRHEELGKEYDFDALIEKYRKKHMKDYLSAGWSFD